MALVKAYRHFGHMAARLDPLGRAPPGDPALDPAPLGLTDGEHGRDPGRAAAHLRARAQTLAEALPHLQRDVHRHDRLRGGAHRLAHRARLAAPGHRVRRAPCGRWRPRTSVALLERLVGVESLERFLHKAYLGQKRFSIEGLDAMVPMLDVILGDAADHGARKVMIGMAHRGRLNVLAHVVGRQLRGDPVRVRGRPRRRSRRRPRRRAGRTT